MKKILGLIMLFGIINCAGTQINLPINKIECVKDTVGVVIIVSTDKKGKTLESIVGKDKGYRCIVYTENTKLVSVGIINKKTYEKYKVDKFQSQPD